MQKRFEHDRPHSASRSVRCGQLLVWVWAAGLVIAPRMATAASSDLATDAARLATTWAEGGAGALKVSRLSSIFLERGHPRTLRLSPSSYGLSGEGCTSLAFLAGRSVDFVVHIDPVIVPKHRPAGGSAQRSIAGATLLIRCGAARRTLQRLAVELRASRAALEVVVAEGPAGAPDISSVLLERATGPLAPPFDPGPRLSVEPLDARAAHAEERARRTGATRVDRRTILTGPEGVGSELLEFSEGCHRVLLMPDIEPEMQVDLDAELRDAATGRVVSRDRSDATDAKLEACVGARARLLLAYTGAASRAPLMLVDATFAMPDGIPRDWGARARAGLAAAMFRHKLAPVSGAPIDLRLGAAGLTPMRLHVEPGSCYVSALTPLAGDPRLAGLTASVDAKQIYDTAAGGTDGAAIAYCAEQLDRVDIQVEVRGSAATWLLASWKVASIRLGDR